MPWSGIVGAPFVLLCNLLVTTAEDNAKADGFISLDAVETIQALVRHRYDFPDLALDEGRGVALSLIGQFFHVDDYGELRIDRRQRDHVLALLQNKGDDGGKALFDLQDRQLCQSTISDPQTMVEQEGGFAAWYKQRLFAFYFVGERAQIERLTQEPPGDELLQRTLGVLGESLDLSEQLAAFIHPAFIPAAKMPEVSRQNAMEWAEMVKKRLEDGKLGAISVVGPPGPLYIVRREGKELE